MPKDPKKNVDSYKIRGGDLNEFEFDQNQEAFATQKQPPDASKTSKTTAGKTAKKSVKAAKKK